MLLFFEDQESHPPPGGKCSPAAAHELQSKANNFFFALSSFKFNENAHTSCRLPVAWLAFSLNFLL